ASLDHQIHAVVDRERSVALDRALELEDAPAAALAFRKADGGRLLGAGRRFQALHLFEQLDAALDQAGLARLVAEAADEGLHVPDLFALFLVGRELELKALPALDQVARVAARIIGQP